MAPRSVLRKEWIGKEVKVDSICGTVIDETKNLLVVKVGKSIKKFVKKNHNFTIIDNNSVTHIEGKKIVYRSEDRIKIK